MKVSVLINNYNYGRFLRECIDSILAQDYKNVEIVLYDDGSKDNSLSIAESYAGKIKLISMVNYGKKPSFNQANAINQAFAKSEGDIIILLDSDDYITPEKISRVVEKFQEDDEIVLVQNSAYVTQDDKIIRIHNYAYKGDNYLKHYYKERWTSFFNPTSCLSFRRTYLNKVLPLQEDDLWQVWPDVRLSRVAPFYGKVSVIDQPLTYYRRHTNNDSSAMNRKRWLTLQNQVAHHRYINKILSNKGLKPISYHFSFYYMKFLVKAFALW